MFHSLADQPSQSFSTLSELDQSLSSLSAVSSSQTLRQASFAGIISQCSRMQKVFAVIEKVAQTDSTVLVLGESGTGKELVARALHRLSGRKGKLVPVNCGAIPEEILESELFGHERGAFTGATNARIGRFQMADGGTIFLDEIGEMSPKLQVKLLRVLQERVVEPVGSTKSISINVRVVAATNKDLRKEVEAGRFREDLFYRLQVVPVELPPLRDRGTDAAVLAQYFLERECRNIGAPTKSFSSDTLRALSAFPWPGNVRELENLIQRLVILSEGSQILLSDLPEYISGAPQSCQIIESTDEIPDEGLNFNELVNQFEERLITMALDKTNWNKKAAARLLQLNRTTLVEKIKKKGLEQPSGILEEDDARPTFQ